MSAVKIPPGEYVLDQGMIVHVVAKDRKRFLQFSKNRSVQILTATFGKYGWVITCRLFQKEFKAILTKRPVIKPKTQTLAS